MDLGLKGKAALVIAASKGLGRGAALALSSAGAQVAISARDGSTLAETAAAIEQTTGAPVVPIAGDVTLAADCDRMVAATVAAFGRLDALVISSGGPPAGPFMDLADLHWEQAYQLNVLSVVRLIRAAVPHLRAAGGGRIVVVASSSIKMPIPNLVLSNTLRAGLVGLVKTLSAELAPAILINIAAPGRIDTDRLRGMESQRADRLGVSVAAVRAAAQKEIPLGRYGTPEEFGQFCAYLASPANSYITGGAVLVDGGLIQAL